MHKLKSNYFAIALIIIVLWVGLFIIFNSLPKKMAVVSPPPPFSPVAKSNSTTSNQVLGVQAKTADCQIQNSLPDPACTPGAIFADVTNDQVCTPGYASSVRNVPASEKNQANLEYNLPTKHDPGTYEIDHLISLELGGSNDISNLWPEAADPRPGFHEKDKVENYLHDQVCSGTITLHQAQQEIATKWLAIYQQIQK